MSIAEKVLASRAVSYAMERESLEEQREKQISNPFGDQEYVREIEGNFRRAIKDLDYRYLNLLD